MMDRDFLMKEFARHLRLILEKREKTEHREPPSQAFRRYFGPEHGVELLLPRSYGYRPVVLLDGDIGSPLEGEG